MRYAYRCDACRLTWDARDSHASARGDQEHHRDEHHRYARPDDQILQAPGSLDQLGSDVLDGIGVLLRLLVRALRSPGFRKATESDWLRQAALLLGTGVLVLLAIRHFTT
ncbi:MULTISPECIES: hypothetical protein [unclassified Streptomyces]|uniref:hypothetical protein n=1 Tax=unclassified Streptomyces TaxID=2593676 RepID=UPI00380C2A24